jgi:Nickel/cobalt transporter regulator
MSAPAAGVITAVMLAGILALALPGSATAQHDEDHRGGGHPPPQHPGGGPPPPKPFIAPRGPNTGAPPGAQTVNPGGGPHPGAEFVRPGEPHPGFEHPGGPHPGAEFVRPGEPHPGFEHPGGPHPGAEFVRPGEPHPRAEFARPGGAQFIYRGRAFERVRSAPFVYPPGWGYQRWAIGAFVPPVFLVRDYWYPDWDLLGLPPPPPDYQWVRYGSDLLLVDLTSGEVVEVVYDVFYY